MAQNTILESAIEGSYRWVAVYIRVPVWVPDIVRHPYKKVPRRYPILRELPKCRLSLRGLQRFVGAVERRDGGYRGRGQFLAL